VAWCGGAGCGRHGPSMVGEGGGAGVDAHERKAVEVGEGVAGGPWWVRSWLGVAGCGLGGGVADLGVGQISSGGPEHELDELYDLVGR
jgi:hypothetical protein